MPTNDKLGGEGRFTRGKSKKGGSAVRIPCQPVEQTKQKNQEKKNAIVSKQQRDEDRPCVRGFEGMPIGGGKA